MCSADLRHVAYTSATYTMPYPRLPHASLQVLVKQAARSSLSLPSWFPSRWLLCLLRLGGMGFPCLSWRQRLHHLLHTELACQSRRIYTSALIRGLLFDSVWQELSGSDPLRFQTYCTDLGLTLCVEPCLGLQAPVMQSCWLRTSLRAPFPRVSDGAASGHAIGFAAVLIDAGRCVFLGPCVCV